MRSKGRERKAGTCFALVGQRDRRRTLSACSAAFGRESVLRSLEGGRETGSCFTRSREHEGGNSSRDCSPASALELASRLLEGGRGGDFLRTGWQKRKRWRGHVMREPLAFGWKFVSRSSTKGREAGGRFALSCGEDGTSLPALVLWPPQRNSLCVRGRRREVETCSSVGCERASGGGG